MSWLRPRTAVLAGTAAMLAFAGIAAADGDDSSPRTDQARAVLDGGQRISVRQTVCRGEDGEYREALEVFRGTATSADSRLNGALRVTVRSLINRSPDQQEGTVEGTIVIRDETSGRKRAEGRFFAVSDDAATLEGIIVGRTFGGNADEQGAERLYANFFGRFNAMDDERDFQVTLGQEPPTDSTRNSAVLQLTECPGGPGAPSGVADDD